MCCAVLYLVWCCEGVVVEGGEVAGPGVEHLDHLGAALDLEVGVQADVFCQLGQHGVQHLRLLVGERLDLLVLHTGPALHLKGFSLVCQSRITCRAIEGGHTMYVARVYGSPTKPNTVALLPTSWRRFFKAWATKGVDLYGSMRRILSTSSMVVQVFILGPSFSVISKSMPMPGNGVKMSENKMHPSVPYALQGCKLRDGLNIIGPDWIADSTLKNEQT